MGHLSLCLNCREMRVSVQSPGITMADLEEVESPRRPRRSVAPAPGEKFSMYQYQTMLKNGRLVG